MAAKETLLTNEGIHKLEAKLEHLKGVKRLEVAERIKQALSFGDIKENSEYDEAKNEQAFLEGEIVALETMLRTAKVIDESQISTKEVGVGVKAKLLDIEFNEEVEYMIVGSAEADPSRGYISNESPVGRALLGQKVGDMVEASTPGGPVQYKVLEISR